MAIVNLGIPGHVDAGKTSLTERILFETGVITAVGGVDQGTTRTDTMEPERARGITIRSAVVPFRRNGLTVDLIDTPGHPDFVAEVERLMRVLDGVVLVQAQTRRLARAARAAGLPILLFVNKVDRRGARGEPLREEIRRKPKLRPVATNAAVGIGLRTAAVEPVAGVLGVLAVAEARSLLPYALAFRRGAMIFVVAEELIQESQRGRHGDLATLALLVGFATMMTLDVALG